MQAAKKTGREPNLRQLPRGRHGIPREQVALDQRLRILEGMVRTVGDKGYAATSVQDVLERAGVSRKTFYDNFADKEACFLEAYDAVVARVMHEINKAPTEPGPWSLSVRRRLRAFLKFFAYEPGLARMAVVEVLAAGPEAIERYRAAVRGFIPLFAEGHRLARNPEQIPDEMAEAIVGGIGSVIYNRVAEGRSEEVPNLLPALLYFALLPYIGAAQATREANKAREDPG